MSKDKKKSKKKGAKSEVVELSKKQRKALEAREAQLAAELAEREAAEKKSKKKGAKPEKAKKKKWADIPAEVTEDDPDVIGSLVGSDIVEPDSGESAILNAKSDDLPTPTAEEVVVAADKVLKGNSSEGAVESALKAKDRVALPADADDKSIKARVKAKAAARKALDSLDRDDVQAVAEFNQTHGMTIGHFATSTQELEAVSKWLHGEDRAPTNGDVTTLADENPLPAKGKGRRAEKIEPSVVEEVATETGRVFEAASATAPEESSVPERGFAIPSDAKPEVEMGRNGYVVVQPGNVKKTLQYTRITTFIKLIEDKSNLEKWSKRKLLAGLVIDQTPDESGAVVDRLGKVRDLIHNRDVMVAKARKADRKGKLGVGELATLIDGAERTLREPLNAIVEELELLGGSKDAAQKGTDIHALTEIYDAEGIEPIAQLLADEKITPADFADLEAYGAAMQAAQIKVLETEVMVVNDEKRRAGRLDKVVMVRFPGFVKSVRCVADVKTGSLEYGISVPMQLENYSSMEAYDPENPTERRKLGLSPTRAVVIHLPQGKGECHIYPVDLATGRLGNRITQEAREYRNTAKKGIDFATDLATGIAYAKAEAE
jgi:hypothetical protein